MNMQRHLWVAISLCGMAFCFAKPLLAAPTYMIFNEGDAGVYDLTDKMGSQSMPGEMRMDPATNKPAWSYALPQAAMAANGDVLISGGPTDPNDLLRFRNNIVYVYSEIGNGEKQENLPGGMSKPFPPADVASLPPNTPGIMPLPREFNEDDYNNGFVYSPKQGQPGFGPNQNLFLFISDGDGGVRLNRARPVPPASSSGKSVSYQAATQQLAFSDDHITDTVFSDDPMLGADVHVPALYRVGTLGNGTVLFQSSLNSDFSISKGTDVFLHAHLAALNYDPVNNTFSGALSDLNFNTSLGSPWADRGADVFDPTSANFDPKRLLDFTYRPDNDFFAMTQAFSVDGTSSGVNGIAPTPEPSTSCILVVGLSIISGYCAHTHRHAASHPSKRH
jgi:hypothetical protein